MSGFASPLYRKRGYAAGERTALVTVQSMTESVGSSGEPEERWTEEPSFQTLMSKQDLDMRESFVANQVTTPYMTRWQMNYRRDMDPDVLDVPKLRRLLFKGRVYNIIGATVVEGKKAIEMLTQAGGVIQ